MRDHAAAAAAFASERALYYYTSEQLKSVHIQIMRRDDTHRAGASESRIATELFTTKLNVRILLYPPDRAAVYTLAST